MDNDKNSELTVIGRAERIDLPAFNIFKVPAKTDTGADSSAIWGSNIKETAEGLEFTLFGPESEFYTGEKLVFGSEDFDVTRVANSFGDRELRYKIKLTVRVKRRLVKGSFTLADRSLKTYPILLGRKLLSGKFVVDVKAGQPLRKEERQKRQQLEEDLKEMGGMG